MGQIEIPEEALRANKHVPEMLLPLIESRIEVTKGEYEMVRKAYLEVKESYRRATLVFRFLHIPERLHVEWMARRTMNRLALALAHLHRAREVMLAIKSSRTA